MLNFFKIVVAIKAMDFKIYMVFYTYYKCIAQQIHKDICRDRVLIAGFVRTDVRYDTMRCDDDVGFL
jgi:hypothetical protein